MIIPFILAFLAGDMVLQTFSSLPSINILLIVMAVSFLLAWNYRKWFFILLFAFVSGLTWSAWYANAILSWTLPKEMEGTPIVITGYIASLPVQHPKQVTFHFSLTSIQAKRANTTIRLVWGERLQPIKVGEQWQLNVKLKRIHSSQNPGQFDYEAWALQKGLRASGIVITSSENKLLSHHWYHYPVDQFRQWLQQQIQVYLPHIRGAHWLMALMIGERQNIPPEEWEVLRRTGTNHLMAIGGLHIGILAGLVYHMTSWLWRRSSRLLFWIPAGQASVCIALMLAIMYCILAGFSIPTQRACFMLCLFSIVLIARRQTNPWHVWALALFVVLFINPLSILSESFWLSFFTIAIILYGMRGRLAPTGWWWKHGRVQWMIGAGLIPLSLLFFHEFSIVSVIANCIAIPWLAFFILPFCFLSTIFLFVYPSLAKIILWFAGKNLSLMWMMLSWFAQLPLSAWHIAMPNYFIFLITFSAFFILLLPAGVPGRWLGLIWLLPLIYFQPPQPVRGEVWLTLLDVGQGLSAVIKTEKHTLVFDTGPKLGESDAGENIVLPFLQTQQIKKIDMLVISHGDNDHIGGAQALIRALSVKQIKTSVPKKMPYAMTSVCSAGFSWKWDKVTFTFLNPSKDGLDQGNNSSCVLHIKNENHAILLTGDIEKKAEIKLLSSYQSELAADILIAPHHGSKTSSTKEFVEVVNPQYVLYPIGYRNRYHFPHPNVVATYSDLKIIQLDTANEGAIQFKIGKKNSKPITYRTQYHRYWHDY